MDLTFCLWTIQEPPRLKGVRSDMSVRNALVSLKWTTSTVPSPRAGRICPCTPTPATTPEPERFPRQRGRVGTTGRPDSGEISLSKYGHTARPEQLGLINPQARGKTYLWLWARPTPAAPVRLQSILNASTCKIKASLQCYILH